MRRAFIPILATAVLVGALAPQTASAQSNRRAAKVHHDAGINHYNVGRFEEAIEEFQKAYDAEPHPTLLFNMGKAHARLRHHERAIFFYRRYLQMAPEAKDAADVQGRIRELEAQLAKQNDAHQPTVPPPPPPGGPAAPPPPAMEQPAAQRPLVAQSSTATPSAESAAPGSAAGTAETRAETVRLSIEGGVAFPALGGARNNALEGATIFAGRLAAERPIAIGSASLDVGLAATFSPLAYETTEATRKTSFLVGALLTATLRYPVAERFSLAGSVGGGVVWWTGLDDGHPFTSAGKAIGAVPMPSARVSVGLFWRPADRLFVGILPAFTFSKTTGDALPDEVSSLRRFELGASVGVSL